MYVSIPFCSYKGIDKNKPEKCGFCLLPTVPFSRKILKQYFKVLTENELPKYARYFGRSVSSNPVKSVFLGGGTPNIMSTDLYTALMEAVQHYYEINHDTEISTEGTPELYSYKKISHFRKLGGTRISFGVQQFNEDLLPLSGRFISKAYTKKMISFALEKGLSVSVDLIYGWPDQTVDRFLSELLELNALGVNRITAYPLNINRSCYFRTEYYHRLPDMNTVKEMYLQSSRLLSSLGYTSITLNDYEQIPGDGSRPHRLRHEEAMRTDHISYRIGLGFAAASKLLFHKQNKGITFKNYSNRKNGMKNYLDTENRNIFPVEKYFVYSGEDLLLNYISGSLQTFHIDLNDLKMNFPDADLDSYILPAIEVLRDKGWIEKHDDSVIVTPEGKFFTHIIQGAFFCKRVKELRMGLKHSASHN